MPYSLLVTSFLLILHQINMIIFKIWSLSFECIDDISFYTVQLPPLAVLTPSQHQRQSHNVRRSAGCAWGFKLRHVAIVYAIFAAVRNQGIVVGDLIVCKGFTPDMMILDTGLPHPKWFLKRFLNFQLICRTSKFRNLWSHSFLLAENKQHMACWVSSGHCVYILYHRDCELWQNCMAHSAFYHHLTGT